MVSCPAYYYTNNTYKYCVKCHYSCSNCSAPALENACSSCEGAKFRELVNGSVCSCMASYFDNSTALCVSCHSSCLSCESELTDGCLSCNASLKRTLNVSTCLCMEGYYENTTCLPCSGNCLTCSFVPANTTYVCSSCNSTNNRTLDPTNTSCICLPAYYSVTFNCLPCDLGCLNCTGPSLCSLCNTTAHFTLISGQCQCSPSYSLNNSLCILSTSTCGNGLLDLS